MTKVIDLTQPWSIETPPWPYFPNPQVEAFHTFARNNIFSLILKSAMHVGTHMDAPRHLSPTGRDMASVPIEDLYGTGLVIDLSSRVEDWTRITVELVEQAAPEPVQERDIVVLHTGWQRYNWLSEEQNEDAYFARHPGPTPELVDYLIAKRVKWIGVDTPAFEHPLDTAIRDMRPDAVEEFEAKMGRPIEQVLPKRKMLYAHRTTGRHNVPLVENMGGDLVQVLNRRVTLGAFPWRWVRGEAAFCRVVAFVEE
ncbi:MAG: cyclase family protein [Dehalococcoidia bacterium]